MSNTTEKDYGGKTGIGQHIDPNKGPSGLNSGQREIVRDKKSITPLNHSEAVGRVRRGDTDYKGE